MIGYCNPRLLLKALSNTTLSGYFQGLVLKQESRPLWLAPQKPHGERKELYIVEPEGEAKNNNPIFKFDWCFNTLQPHRHIKSNSVQHGKYLVFQTWIQLLNDFIFETPSYNQWGPGTWEQKAIFPIRWTSNTQTFSDLLKPHLQINIERVWAMLHHRYLIPAL